ncbi:unnamed protein product [Linum trigynum]|uniref:Uncharacterized protein n=1 Tax=Linum trigynum TaxID=586398 RepID=A0AAV2EHN1_9ROSI
MNDVKRSFAFIDVNWGNVSLVAFIHVVVQFAPYVVLIPLLTSLAGYKFLAYGSKRASDDDGIMGWKKILEVLF